MNNANDTAGVLYYLKARQGYVQGLIFSFLFLFFFAIRIYRIGLHDFWYDEVNSIFYAKHFSLHWNEPLYITLLHFWIKIFGISELSLRLPSVFFSFSSIVILYFLGKELFNSKIALSACLLMGFSPLHLWYAQEARNYSMLLFFGIASSYALYRLVRRQTIVRWGVFIVLSLLGALSSYFHIVLFFMQCLYFFSLQKEHRRLELLIPFLIIMAGISCTVPALFQKAAFVSEGFWIPQPTYQSLRITIENFVIGYNGLPVLYLISSSLTGLLFFGSITATYRKQISREGLVFCVVFCVLPIITIFIFSKLFFSIYLDRSLIVFSPYLYCIMAAGLYSFGRLWRTAAITILAAIIFIACYGYFNDWMFMPLQHHSGTYLKKPIKPAARFLTENKQPDDMVVFTNESTMSSVKFYSPKSVEPFYYLFDPQFPDTSWQRPVQETAFFVPLRTVSNFPFSRLWVFASDWARSGALDRNSSAAIDWLNENLVFETVTLFDGLWVFRYRKKT